MTKADGGGPGRPAVTVYGAATCEDTAITRSRLRALDVPFREIDIDEEPAGLARVLALEGRRVTPTVVLGPDPAAPTAVVAEPSIERLEQLVREAGIAFVPPAARQVRGPLADRPIPFRAVPRAGGGDFSLEAGRGRRATALFLAHEASCLACFGFAKQLARQAEAMAEADADPLVVSRDDPQALRHWAAEMPAGAILLGDPAGAWTREIQAALSLEPGAVALLVLDRYAAARAVSVAAEAGGLVGPAEATEWLRFLLLECPECGNDVAWPD